jgi:Uma2 family endonuclease
MSMMALFQPSVIIGRASSLRPRVRRGDTMGMAAPLYHTAEMVRALTDETRHWPRYETVHGELLVTPAPRPWHLVVAGRLYIALHSYLEREPVGTVFMSPADISWGVDTLVQPDVFVVPIQEARTLAWPSMRTLLLAVEILSPSSVRADRFTKRRLYQEVGVSEYWVIDADAATAEIWMPSDQLPRTEIERLVWSPPDASQPFEVSLAELLRPV